MTKAEDQQNVLIKTVKEPMFRRNFTKNEANIQPDAGSTIKIAKPKIKEVEVNAYENQINSRITKDAQGFSKFTFAGKETFDQALILSQKIPRWNTQAENPINNFVPPSTTTYRSEPEEVLKEREQR